MSKSKHIMQLSNIIEAINEGIITVTTVRSECKLASDCTDRTEIPLEKFVESVELLDKTIFKDAIDFGFEFVGDNQLIIKCGTKNTYMDVYFYANCVISDDVSVNEVEKKLRQNIFDKIA